MHKSYVSIQFILFISLAGGSSTYAMHAPTQSLSAYAFKSASVLPVTYFIKKGKPVKYLILGREAAGQDAGTYDDFGGKRDTGEKHPVATASREFFEEAIIPGTLGWNLQQTRNFIDLNSKNTEVILASNNAVTYVTLFPKSDISKFRSLFHGAFAQQKSHKFKEKDRIATVRWDALESAICKSKTNTGVTVEARLIDPKTGKDEGHRTLITLRPFFVKRMRPLFENWKYQQGKSPKIRFY